MARWWHHASALTVYREPDERISFGDIFESECLIDVYVAGDTRALGGGPMNRKAAEKIAKHNNLELTDHGDTLAVYTPAMKQHPDRFHVLGRGSNMKHESPNRAILLSDSCAADTALAVDRKGRRRHGRLLFAPVISAADDNEVERLLMPPVFGRFPLAKCTVFEHGAVAELRYCFMVDVQDVRADARILALTNEAAEDLEVAWSAYALRRGPLTTERNVEKLATIVAGDSDSRIGGLPELIGEAINIAWRLEGDLADVAETASLDHEKVAQLASDLREMAEAARTAHERLASARPDEESRVSDA